MTNKEDGDGCRKTVFERQEAQGWHGMVGMKEVRRSLPSESESV